MYLRAAAAVRTIWTMTMEPDTAATVIIVITVITRRSEPRGPQNKTPHLCLHKSPWRTTRHQTARRGEESDAAHAPGATQGAARLLPLPSP